MDNCHSPSVKCYKWKGYFRSQRNNITGIISHLQLGKKMWGNWNFPQSRLFSELENNHLCVTLTRVKSWRTFLNLNTCSEMTPCQLRPVILLETISRSFTGLSWTPKKRKKLLNLCNAKVYDQYLYPN